MNGIQRKSPVSLPARPAKMERRQDWTVVLEYDGEGSGPWLIDLSHCPKWDLQDADVSRLKPFGMSVPDEPGKCTAQNGMLVNRMTRTQASVWCLRGQNPKPPESQAFTEITEGQLLLALLGKQIFSVTEKLTSLHIGDLRKTAPFFLQGPFSHVPCQIVVLERNGLDGAFLLPCPRGYGDAMANSILESGKEFGLRPAGEYTFARGVQWKTEVARRKVIESVSIRVSR